MKLFLASFFLLFFVCSSAGFDSGDAVTRLETAKSLLRGQAGELPSSSELNNLARASDGRVFAAYHPLQSLLMVPGLAVVQLLPLSPGTAEGVFRLLFNLLFLPLLSTATLLILFLALTSYGYGRKASLCTCFIIGVATPFLHYARSAQEENLVALGFALWLWGLARLHRGRKAGLWLMALGMSWAFLARAAAVAPLAVLGVVSMIVWLRSRRKVDGEFIGSCLVLGCTVCGMLFYNAFRFGSAFESGYALALAPAGLTTFSFQNVPGRLFALLLSPYRGIFVYCPALIVAFWGFTGERRKKPLGLFEWAGPLAFGGCLALNVVYSYWAAGHSWGPRFLVASVVLFSPLFARVFEAKKLPWGVGAILLLSIAVQGISVLYPSSLEDELRQNHGVSHLDPAASWNFEYSPFYVRPLALLGKHYPGTETLFWWPMRFNASLPTLVGWTLALLGLVLFSMSALGFYRTLSKADV